MKDNFSANKKLCDDSDVVRIIVFVADEVDSYIDINYDDDDSNSIHYVYCDSVHDIDDSNW